MDGVRIIINSLLPLVCFFIAYSVNVSGCWFFRPLLFFFAYKMPYTMFSAWLHRVIFPKWPVTLLLPPPFPSRVLRRLIVIGDRYDAEGAVWLPEAQVRWEVSSSILSHGLSPCCRFALCYMLKLHFVLFQDIHHKGNSWHIVGQEVSTKQPQ